MVGASYHINTSRIGECGQFLQGILDGVTLQDYPVSDMIFGPRQIVSMISREVTLLPGDVIACGTSLGAIDLEPGQTIEVHWVHTTCPAAPGPGLGACLTDGCENPRFRVEAQAFLVVNDPDALDFMDMAYQGNRVDGRHQALSIPSNTGEPVLFRGSTTGPSYTQASCSPFQVTWNVRPNCAKVDINSLHRWAESGNVFEETKSHGVRQLVTAPELLAPIGD